MRITLAALVLAVVGVTASIVTSDDVLDELADTYPPCRAEDDARDCYWDAEHRGNGAGHSFVQIDGTRYYFGG